MKRLDSEQAAGAFLELFKRRPELRTGPLGPPEAALESAARLLLLQVAAENFAAWRAAPEAVQRLARTLLIDFFTKLVMRDPAFASASWPVRSLAKHRQALEVLEHEIRRGAPGALN